jgi:hypothetical protein
MMIRLALAAGGVVACLAGAAGGISHQTVTTTLLSDTASTSNTLTANSSITSANGDYQLLMTADGDLVEQSLYGISPILFGIDDGGFLGGGNASGEDNVTGTYVGSTVTQIWDSGTSGNPGAQAVLQSDGDFVVSSASGTVLWSSDTSGNPGATLSVQNDGNVVLYAGGQALWSTKTVSPIDSLGNGYVNFRNCPDVTFDGCGITGTLTDSTDVTMLCWESLSPIGWATPPPSNKWFYVLVDGTDDQLGYVDAAFIDPQNQIKTPPCIPMTKLGQNLPPAPANPGGSSTLSSGTPSDSTPANAGSNVGQSGTYTETVGGPTHTWSDYSNAGGNEGAVIPSGTGVQVECVAQGFEVADGNTNWYLISSSPWDGAYWASSDAFYNNGATSGSLDGTPLVDPTVPAC